MINGSNDTANYLQHNGGLDYFGNSVSHNIPSNIGAYNGTSYMNIFTANVDDLKFYPSVTDDYVNLSIREYSEPIKTEIYALNGDFLDVQYGDKLSFNKFDAGIYFCSVYYKNKCIIIKIVKL